MKVFSFVWLVRKNDKISSDVEFQMVLIPMVPDRTLPASTPRSKTK